MDFFTTFSEKGIEWTNHPNEIHFSIQLGMEKSSQLFSDSAVMNFEKKVGWSCFFAPGMAWFSHA
jgi:hypothetical protein